MAGRCGCSSSNATGASLQAGSCVTVTGAGTTGSPAVISVDIDPSAANNLECGPDGLFAGAAQVDAASDCISVVGDGSLATPYEIGVVVSPSAGNMLACSPDGRDPGLYATQNPYVLQGGSTLFGGALPADPHWVIESGTHVGTSDVNGHINVPIFTTLIGILSITFCLGDRPVSHTDANLDNGSVGLGGFDIVVEDADAYGTPIAAGLFRINYTVIGWYTP